MPDQSQQRLKTCSKCRETKLLELFSKKSDTKDGKDSWCKACTCKNAIKWASKNPRRIRDGNLQRNYGISLEKFEQIKRDQNGTCAICLTSELRYSTRHHDLSVDHNHLTGKVRGLLCNNCNRAMGMLKDNFEIVLQAARYLHEHEGIV